MSHRFRVVNSSPGTYWIDDTKGSPLWPNGMGLTFDDRDPQNPGLAKRLADRVCEVLNLMAPQNDIAMLAPHELAQDFVLRDCLKVKFQSGPVKERGVNGVQVEDVLEIALDRIRFLNSLQACRENACAITNIEQGLHWLQARTAKRQKLGVEGTHKPHEVDEDAPMPRRFA